MEEIIFKISADAGDANKETDKLESNLEAVNEAAENLMKTNKGLESSFEDVYGELQPLSTRLGELEDRMYELALAGEENTTEFKELQAEAVKYRQVLISVDKSVDQLAEQGRGLGAALQIGTAVVAGYGAVQGAQALLGTESEELEKVFVKLQAVQTILASLEQLKLSLDKQSLVVTKAKVVATNLMTAAQTVWTFATSATTTAMNALRVAMLAIPLVAIIAGVVALVSVLKDLASASEVLEEANDRLNKSYEAARESMEKFDNAAKKSIQQRIDLAKAQGESAEEIHRLELEQLEISETARKKDLKLTTITIKQKRALLKTAYEFEETDLIEKYRGELKEQRDHYKELHGQDGDYYHNRKLLIIEHEKDQEEEEKKGQEKRASQWKKASDERKRQEEQERRLRLERDKLLRDLIIENIEDEEVRKLTALEESHKRQRAQIIKKHGEDTLLIENLERKQANEFIKLTQELEAKRFAEQEKISKAEQEERKKQTELESKDRRAQIEGELIQMREDFSARMELQRELAEFEFNEALLNTELTEGEKFKVKEEFAQKIAELDQQEADRKKQLETDTAAAVKSIYDSSYNAISSLADGIFALRIANAEEGSKKELEIQKRQFEFNKKMQIAQATIQGVQAVQNAFASGAASPITPFFPAYPYIQAAAAGIAAIGNIAKIKSTTFQGGGSVGTTSVNPPTVGTSSVSEPDTDVDTTTLTQGLEGGGQGNNITIVDSQIKQSLVDMDKVKVISEVG